MLQSRSLLVIYFITFMVIFFFWLHWVFVAACRSGGLSSLLCTSFSWRWLLVVSTGSRCTGSGAAARGLSSCGVHAPELRLLLSWHLGLVAPLPVDTSQTRDQTRILCFGRWILIHYTTREVLSFLSVVVCMSIPTSQFSPACSPMFYILTVNLHNIIT